MNGENSINQASFSQAMRLTCYTCLLRQLKSAQTDIFRLEIFQAGQFSIRRRYRGSLPGLERTTYPPARIESIKPNTRVRQAPYTSANPTSTNAKGQDILFRLTDMHAAGSR